MTEWIAANWLESAVLALFAGSAIVQISPLKINPWSWLASKVGKAINKEMMATVSQVQSSLAAHIRLDEERFVKQCRMRILRFNDEVLQGTPHTKEHYDEILDDITSYNRYCNTHPEYPNSKAEMAIKNIEDKYQQHLAEKSFL